MSEQNRAAQKSTLRGVMREKRQLISSDERKKASFALASLFEAHLLPNHNAIACYASSFHEIDTFPLLECCLKAKKNLFLPRVNKLSRHLTFHRVRNLNELSLGAYGIFEPAETALEVKPEALEVMLLPALSVDQEGYRLGMGGGYYDRTLAHVSRRPLLIACVYEFQCTSWVPREAWDVPVNGVLTEERLLFF